MHLSCYGLSSITAVSCYVMNTENYKALSNYIDLLLDAICVVDKFGRFEFVSAGAERIFGYTPAEMLGRPMIELVHPDDRERTLKAAAEINAGAVKIDFENRYIRKDGQIVHLLWSARWSPQDKRRVAVARDISRSKKIAARQDALYAISEAAFASADLAALYNNIYHIITGLLPMRRFAIVRYEVAEDTLDFVCDIQQGQQCTDVRALCRQVINRAETLLVTQDNLSALPSAVLPLAENGALNWLGVPLRSSQAVIGMLMVQHDAQAIPYHHDDAELLEFVSVQVAQAIERSQMLEQLKHNALYDHLTGLPNRQLFYDRLQQARARAVREQQPFALLFLDLDNFKPINDNYGHQAGDSVLQWAALSIQHCLRHTDTVARLGGDEFVVLCEQLASEADALVLAEKMLYQLMQPVPLKGISLQLSCSIGVAVTNGAEDQALVLQWADSAMYQAKQSGGNRISLHQPAVTQNLTLTD